MNKFILLISILLTGCNHMGTVVPTDQIIRLDPSVVASCDPLLKVEPPITFENVLNISIKNMELYAKCSDKHEAAVKLLKKVSNVKE
jgi:hypothetical protein